MCSLVFKKRRKEAIPLPFSHSTKFKNEKYNFFNLSNVNIITMVITRLRSLCISCFNHPDFHVCT